MWRLSQTDKHTHTEKHVSYLRRNTLCCPSFHLETPVYWWHHNVISWRCLRSHGRTEDANARLVLMITRVPLSFPFQTHTLYTNWFPVTAIFDVIEMLSTVGVVVCVCVCGGEMGVCCWCSWWVSVVVAPSSSLNRWFLKGWYSDSCMQMIFFLTGGIANLPCLHRTSFNGWSTV